ncbi:hypothetical protein KGF56_003367 [Candida oxycetoniae]|uniref:U three protein 23 n=1 Tax=Candida oxycetoniae TaxID=497107 RepID=A0AAI9SVQ0_9ASCO|nr:uncharacterized protein KGF56_003367 [Candida oxycetoniae]KAI3403807.2 hypothetical protein KGF56_003367 [Candida oxycetoniae]
MRQKRAKSYKKQMNTYTYTFKFREPYQVILDNEIISTCHSASYDLARGVKRTIQAIEIKPMITQCCMEALYTTQNQPLIDLAKTFERRKCNHRTPINPQDCVESIVDIKGCNKHRYVVATQSLELRKKLRKVPGVPLIYMNRSVMVMEPLSDASVKYSEDWERGKLTGGLNATEAGIIKKSEGGEEGEGGDAAGEPLKKKSKKGPKGPNPLSMKKKKTPGLNNSSPQDKIAKKPNRRRKHTRKTKDQSEVSEGKEEGTKESSNENV